MSRYTGPRVRILRALGGKLPGLTRKDGERRPYPPGQHGLNHRGRVSEYALRLKEKQKLRMNYGVTKRQLVSYMREAKAGPGNAGNRLLALLESRIDNVVFRPGFARTRDGRFRRTCREPHAKDYRYRYYCASRCYCASR